ncbi:MAG TPA: acetolactate synthase large subunit [Candidatus Cybelea sp.]|nr:acetolactate synthase large subunit [Candidatus Cybelea sp.]
MNGAESLVRTLVAGGVNVCFTNPGTSEMHFVAALDRVEGMRCVLGLFEGVITGAADGYARMADKPASTLMHLGPGLGNGLANLHNAKKASSPIVNIVGEHATYHIRHEAPLTADIEGIARPVSAWVRTSADAKSVAADGAEAIAAARTAPGRIATLILPADTAWNPADGIARVAAPAPRVRVSEIAIKNAAKVLRSGEATALLLTGMALRERPLELAGRIATKTGAKVLVQGSNARLQRGAGRVPVGRIPYVVDQALEMLKGFRHIILIEAKEPVAFFAYPDKPSLLLPKGCEAHRLAELGEDSLHALEWLSDELGATREDPRAQPRAETALPSGALNLDSIAKVIGALIPENAIVVDESITTGRGFFPFTAGAPPHDWLQNMGGSIGYGPPVGTGAAIACPDRKVLCLEGDGSAMYTVQSLWTQARENLDVTTVVFANRSYQILKGELASVGAGNPGRKALDMLDIDRPGLDWVLLAKSMGVDAVRVATADDFGKALGGAIRERGPRLIEVQMYKA